MRDLFWGGRLLEDPFMARNEVPANFNNAAEILVESGNLQPKKKRDYLKEYNHAFQFQCPNGNFCCKFVVTKYCTKKEEEYLGPYQISTIEISCLTIFARKFQHEWLIGSELRLCLFCNHDEFWRVFTKAEKLSSEPKNVFDIFVQ